MSHPKDTGKEGLTELPKFRTQSRPQGESNPAGNVRSPFKVNALTHSAAAPLSITIQSRKVVLVRQVSSIFQPNCAFCEESTKFGTLVEYHIMNIFGYWAISNSSSDGCGSHFSKWPPAVTVMVHICFTGEECRLTVKDYSLIKVQ